MSRRNVFVRQGDESVWQRAAARATARSMSMSEVVIAGLKLWLKHDAEHYRQP